MVFLLFLIGVTEFERWKQTQRWFGLTLIKKKKEENIQFREILFDPVTYPGSHNWLAVHWTGSPGMCPTSIRRTSARLWGLPCLPLIWFCFLPAPYPCSGPYSALLATCLKTTTVTKNILVYPMASNPLCPLSAPGPSLSSWLCIAWPILPGVSSSLALGPTLSSPTDSQSKCRQGFVVLRLSTLAPALEPQGSRSQDTKLA